MYKNAKISNKFVVMGCFILGLVFSCNIHAANRLFFEGFEKGSLEGLEAIKSGGTQKITTNNPFEGKYSVRGNLNIGVVDPITGLKGAGLNQFYLMINQIQSNNIPNLDKFFVRYQFKFDDCRWNGTGFGKSLNDPHSLDLKMAYLMMNGHPESSFYVGAGGGSNGSLTLSANNDSWMAWTKKNQNWGKYTMYLNTGAPFGSDGEWHSFSFLFEKGSYENYVTLFIDDRVASRSDLPSGKLKLPLDFLIDSLQIWYTGSAQVNLSTNRTGACNGWQVDNIEVWDGLPVDRRPESPPYFIIE